MRADRGLSTILKKIGIPDFQPFIPDQFQLEALRLVEKNDVLVSAPTGSGKTWIASQAIGTLLSKGRRIWYASPLKALSNSIYNQFCEEFGTERCGIITGDRKENPGAPVIVGTTEILRNQLYDAMHQGLNISADMVVLDEAHYLSDPERGVVWEEVLIYLPSRVRLLLLSASISNPRDLCGWLAEIRGTAPKLVLSCERPVPLEMLFLFPDGLVSILGGKKGLNPKIKKFMEGWKSQTGKGTSPGYQDILECLRKLNLLPAIFFLKSRAECDRAIRLCRPLESCRLKSKISNAVNEFTKQYPHLKSHRQTEFLTRSAVGAHHAGQLPLWKALVEKMMGEGLLDAIFSTSTVAAGVNFPARTVVLMQSDRYNGKGFVDLTATDLHQMIGRAGRRGKDRIGFALVIPGMHQDPELIRALKESVSEPLLSRIQINFSMTLNLLLSHRPSEIKNLLEKSFAAYQKRKTKNTGEIRIRQILKELQEELSDGRCDTSDPLEVIELIEGYSKLKPAMEKETGASRRRRFLSDMAELLTPGRLFSQRNGKMYVAAGVETKRGCLVCAAYRIPQSIRVKGAPRIKYIELSRIRELMDFTLEIKDLPVSDLLARLEEPLPAISPIKISRRKAGGREKKPGSYCPPPDFPCRLCSHLKQCHGGRKTNIRKLLRDFSSLDVLEHDSDLALWLSFKKHLRFLKNTGFADCDNKLTADGHWASRLRVDQPLLIAEAIRRHSFEGISPELLAAGIAPFVWDRSADVAFNQGQDFDISAPAEMWSRINRSIEKIRALKSARGFESPPLQFWPAAALYLWASDADWEKLIRFVSVDEGDMASLIMRTADHLRQIISLSDTHAELARTAGEAIRLIMREPVYTE